MKIPPEYQLIPEIFELLSKIEANRLFLSSLKTSPEIKEKIERQSLLKSSLYSARIEGNPLSFGDLDISSEERKKSEIFNILKAIKFINKNIKKKSKITKKLILNLHKIIFEKISTGGFFRKEMGAIFNQAGVAVYVSPPPTEIDKLITLLLNYINSNKERFPLICAFISHLVFEKIHPFIDGNGRVGRLFVLAILKSKNFDFSLHIPFEEYLDEHKDEYYYFIDKGFGKTNDYLTFMLKSFLEETEKVKDLVLKKPKEKKALLLPPRQEEIYRIIKDHPLIPFDSIKRRFLKVPPRTLRYDLKKLVEKKLVVKIGKTKGSYYQINENRL